VAKTTPQGDVTTTEMSNNCGVILPQEPKQKCPTIVTILRSIGPCRPSGVSKCPTIVTILRSIEPCRPSGVSKCPTIVTILRSIEPCWQSTAKGTTLKALDLDGTASPNQRSVPHNTAVGFETRGPLPTDNGCPIGLSKSYHYLRVDRDNYDYSDDDTSGYNSNDEYDELKRCICHRNGR
jgi:hypothetical protein